MNRQVLTLILQCTILYLNSYKLFVIKAFRLISIYMAMSIAVLHSLVPHVHHAESTEIYCIAEGDISLLEQLSLIFHLDMGDDHLEEFQPGDTLHFDTIEYVDINLDWCPLTWFNKHNTSSSTNQKIVRYIEDPFPDIYLISHHGRRGPPSFS